MSTWLDTQQTTEIIKQLEKIAKNLNALDDTLRIFTDRITWLLEEKQKEANKQ